MSTLRTAESGSGGALYHCEGLVFQYQLGRQKVLALNNLDLEIASGELTCLAGPSGSGKSTLLNVLGLIEPVQQGKVLFQGRDIGRMTEGEKNELRREKLGFVFQHFLLFETLNAFENVEYFLKHRNLSRAEKRDKVDAALASVGLADHKTKRPLEMSGGQRQRVAIARAIVKDPSVIIADEPTASLDQATGRDIMGLFARFVDEGGGSVVFASHDPMAMGFASRIVRLKDGLIEKAESTDA